ncbi:hypothetical protein W97_03770 [Coniosporium apollinis CBS 100218]|uniref:Tyrosine specific protein phosphatases domain-containing protein n=1 Tax=Coniosporium apollinis (strain CBS 100218) TaxID=1168221 RepID=R7YRK4_CONA1|nr:uncharacterized protein W97_03770 [Coniosporium apollinis CBS 100218]EON64537.1 hypothetical protein W97_03770 [Coniosporium apollinis CBS 100218]
MSSLPSPFIPIPNLHNLRDIGGYPLPTAPPTTVRKRILYRSADRSACAASPEGSQQLHSLGITTVFDLRSKPELDRAGGPKEFEGIQRIWCPVFEEEDYSPENVALRYREYAKRGSEGFVAAYGDILSHGGPAFTRILRHLAALPTDAPPACLVHCTAGKDRTGVFCALLLSLLGVSTEDVAEEYALTDVGLAALKPVFVERLLQSEAFRQLGEEAREGVERMVTARKENMEATLEMIRERYGEAEGYVRAVCGLNGEEVGRLREVMMVGVDGAEVEKPVL